MFVPLKNSQYSVSCVCFGASLRLCCLRHIRILHTTHTTVFSSKFSHFFSRFLYEKERGNETNKNVVYRFCCALYVSSFVLASRACEYTKIEDATNSILIEQFGVKYSKKNCFLFWIESKTNEKCRETYNRHRTDGVYNFHRMRAPVESLLLNNRKKRAKSCHRWVIN